MDPKVAQFYAKANLKGNPFRSNATLDNDPRMDIWVGYEREKKALGKFLLRSRSDQIGNSNFLMVYGDLGVGKSHALFWARYQILEAQRAEYNSVCYYIQTLRKDGKISFGAAFREDIVGKSAIVADVLSCKQFLDECVVEYRRDNNLGMEVPRDSILQKLVGSVELFNFAKLVVDCGNETDVRALLLPAKSSDFTAMTLLCRLINLFVLEISLPKSTKRFKKGAYLFIDELDLLATSTAKEAREANELIRHIYDSCPNCFCLVLSFTASAAELNILFAEYVLSRVSRQVVMQLLDLDEAKVFVRDILDNDSVRADKSGKRGYYPFDEGAVQTVVSQIVSITPRKVINAMQQVLEEVRLLGYDFSKGPVTAKYLDDNDIIEDVLGQ
ncbi:MAG: hypothetical protein ING33_03225 [Rhodocyclaceae bacterium]|nr:hypothetical protein [Rhodocyclaceae bacterium]